MLQSAIINKELIPAIAYHRREVSITLLLVLVDPGSSVPVLPVTHVISQTVHVLKKRNLPGTLNIDGITGSIIFMDQGISRQNRIAYKMIRSGVGCTEEADKKCITLVHGQRSRQCGRIGLGTPRGVHLHYHRHIGLGFDTIVFYYDQDRIIAAAAGPGNRQ